MHPFQGDATQHQLSFARGAIFRVDHRAVASSSGNGLGWTWGSLVMNADNDMLSSSGWFPSGYVAPTLPPHSSANTATSKPTSPPSLPWIQTSHEQENNHGNNAAGAVHDDGFAFLGGQSPALDYTSPTSDFQKQPTNTDNYDANPFTSVTRNTSPRLLNHLDDNDRITIVDNGKPKNRFGLQRKLQKGWEKVGHVPVVNKLLHRRGGATEDPMKPSITITPTTTNNTSASQ